MLSLQGRGVISHYSYYHLFAPIAAVPSTLVALSSFMRAPLIVQFDFSPEPNLFFSFVRVDDFLVDRKRNWKRPPPAFILWGSSSRFRSLFARSGEASLTSLFRSDVPLLFYMHKNPTCLPAQHPLYIFLGCRRA